MSAKVVSLSGEDLAEIRELGEPKIPVMHGGLAEVPADPIQALNSLEAAIKAAIQRVEDAGHQAVLRIELGLHK